MKLDGTLAKDPLLFIHEICDKKLGLTDLL